MARAIWSGVLSFGLVSVPVELYTATEIDAMSGPWKPADYRDTYTTGQRPDRGQERLHQRRGLVIFTGPGVPSGP